MACATISLKRGLDFDPLSPRRPKRRRCIPMTISPSTSATPKAQSVFKDATSSMSKEQIAVSIKSEIKRLKHRRQLVNGSSSASDSSSDSEHTHTAISSTETASPNKKDNVPLFTFKQMTMLCERIVREKTEELRDEYDQVLASKLSEQYESFLKFNHDQLQRHFSHTPDASYLS